MKTMVDLANPAYDQKLDEIAGKIVENHALGEKDAGYLNKEFYLDGGFKDIDVVKETSKIVQQQKQPQEKNREPNEPTKTMDEPEKTQSKGREDLSA